MTPTRAYPVPPGCWLTLATFASVLILFVIIVGVVILVGEIYGGI